jgi:hypothetical protein
VQISLVPLYVGEALLFPKIRISGWSNTAVSAGMHVEKTPMDIDYFATANEHNVWLARQVTFVKSVSITQTVHD